MPTTKFIHIANWEKKGPVIEVKFEIFDKYDKSLGLKTKKFLFDSGNDNGLVLSASHIQDFELDPTNLITTNISSPGSPSTLQQACFTTIHEINVNKKNILEKPMERVLLIFSVNPDQTPLIGQTSFFEYSCCIDYKQQKFSVDKS